MGICFGLCGSKNPEEAKSDDDLYITQKYEQGVTLGKGGSCRVVQCKEKKTGKKFALKIMASREKMNAELFAKERDILQLLDHENIMTYVEDHVDSTNYYIVSELYEGGELFDRIVDQNNPLTETRVSELVRTMLLAIQHCHSKNIVHRDIKPENFVFKTKDKNSDMVLIDFGCAKIVEDKTPYKDLVGTPYYLAPESAVGHKYIRTGTVLKSSDVWSIGVIAYVMLTGRPPFNGQTNTEIFQNIIKKPLKFPHKVKLSKNFIEFCQLMLKKSPKRRLKLEKALEHPWVQGKNTSNAKVAEDVIRVLRQFNQQSKLKKAITKTLATNMGTEPQKKIREQFDRLDKNGDGALDANELSLLLIDMGFTKTQAHTEATKIIQTTDVDGSGEIEFEEFAQIWQRKLLSVNDSYIHAVFSVLDEDGNGTIESHELAKVLNLQGEADKEKIDELIKEVDTDGDGVISWDEFYNAMVENNDFGGKGADVGQELNENELPAMADVDLDKEEDHEEKSIDS